MVGKPIHVPYGLRTVGTDVEITTGMRIYIGVALFAAACTGEITGAPAPLQTPPPAPPPTTVLVTVRDGNVLQPGVDVLFQNSDGSVVLEAKTDSGGAAMATMDTGTVTIARTFAAVGSAQRAAEIYTYVGVNAGDHLVLGDATDDTGAPTIVNVAVPTGATGNVTITSPCGTGTGTAPTVAMSMAGCPKSVEFYVKDDDDSSFLAGATFGSNIDLSAGDLEGTLGTSFSASNVTPDMTSVDVNVFAMDASNELYSSGNQTIATGSDAAPETINLPDLHGVDEVLVRTITSTKGTQMVSSRFPYAALPTPLDASAHLLPYVSSASFKACCVAWTETGSGTADFSVSTLAITPASGGAAYTRHIIAAHSGSSLAVPKLAGNQAIYNPVAADAIAGSVGIGSFDGGYHAAAEFAFGAPNFYDTTPISSTIALSYAGEAAPAF